MLQLDVLRGVAILLVLGDHPAADYNDAGIFGGIARTWFRGGWTGVDLFFVLSGFLIGGLLMKELRTRGRLDVKRFLFRRMMKIWPAYFALVFAAMAVAWAVSGWRTALRNYWPNLVQLQNYFGDKRLGITWSLAVEEHFYLILPLLILLLVRLRALRMLPLLAIGAAIACTAMRLVFNLHRPFQPETHYGPTHLRIDSLAFGVMLAYFYHFHPIAMERVARHRAVLLLVGLALIMPMFTWDMNSHPFVWTIGFTMLYVGYGCILTAAVHIEPLAGRGMMERFFAGRTARLLAAVGVFSYSIYLWQIVLWARPLVWLSGRLHLMSRLGPSVAWPVIMALHVAGAYLVGVVMAKLIEFPLLAVRDRLAPARAVALHDRTA